MVTNWARQDFPALAPPCGFRCSSASPSTRGSGSPIRRRWPRSRRCSRAHRGFRSTNNPGPGTTSASVTRPPHTTNGVCRSPTNAWTAQADRASDWRQADATSDSSAWAARAARWRGASSKPATRRRCGHARPASSNRSPTPPPRSPGHRRNSPPPATSSACASSAMTTSRRCHGENGVLAGLKPGGVVAIHSTVHPETCHESGRKGRRTGCFGDRRTGQRRRTGGRRGPAAGHGRRRRRRRRTMPPGIRELCRPDRAPRPAGLRADHQAPEQPAVHRQPGHRGQHAGARRVPRHLARTPHRGHLPRQRKQLRAQRAWR